MINKQFELPYERFFNQELPKLNENLQANFNDILIKCHKIRSVAFWIYKKQPSAKTIKGYIRVAKLYHDIYGLDNFCTSKMANLWSDIDKTNRYNINTL